MGAESETAGDRGLQDVNLHVKMGRCSERETASGKGPYALLLLPDAGLHCIEFLQGMEDT